MGLVRTAGGERQQEREFAWRDRAGAPDTAYLGDSGLKVCCCRRYSAII